MPLPEQKAFPVIENICTHLPDPTYGGQKHTHTHKHTQKHTQGNNIQTVICFSTEDPETHRTAHVREAVKITQL